MEKNKIDLKLLLGILVILVIVAVLFGVVLQTKTNENTENNIGEGNTKNEEVDSQIEEQCKQVLEKYLNLYNLSELGTPLLCCYDSLETYGLQLYDNYEEMEKDLQPSNEMADINGTEALELSKTSIEFIKYKEAMLEYVSEELFEKEFTIYHKNIDGILYVANLASEGSYFKVKKMDLSAYENGVYNFNVIYEFAQGENPVEDCRIEASFTKNSDGKMIVKYAGKKYVKAMDIDNSENIIIYDIFQMQPKTGLQVLDYMDLTDENNNKFNTTYYNYANGEYQGISVGEFGCETAYEDMSFVKNVSQIAMTKKFNAIPRKCEMLKKIPAEIINDTNYSELEVMKIDLDGDQKYEYIVCGHNDSNETELESISKVMLYDNNYKKIADIVELKDDFVDGEEVVLTFANIACVDLDNDNIMEIIIDVPIWEGKEVDIIKYNKGKIDGEINYQASIRP